MKKNYIYVLLLILILGGFIRIPGLFYGYHVFDKEIIGFSSDESIFARITYEFLNFTIKTEKDIGDVSSLYVKGYGFQVFLLSLPLNLFIKISYPILAAITRILSLVYSLLTIILIFLISLELLKNKKAALIAALFLSLTGIHVIYSHIAKPDIANVFWIYMVFYLSFLFIKKKNNIFLLLAAFSSGVAIGTNFAIITLFPLIYLIIKSDKKVYNLLLVILVVSGSFALVNGFSYTPDNFMGSLYFIGKGTTDVRTYNSFINPLLYFIKLLPSLGLLIFILSLYGIILFIKKFIKNKDVFFIMILPLIIYFIQINIGDYTFSRYMLPLIPALALIASYGFMNLKFLKRKIFTIAILLIIVYQLVYVGSLEYNYVFDTTRKMGGWMRENIDNNKLIYIGDKGNKYLSGDKFLVNTNATIKAKYRAVNRQGVVIPSEYKTADLEDADYYILREKYLTRYIPSGLNPFYEPKCCDEVYHCTYKDCIFIQNLVKNKTQFRLLKKIDVVTLTPELIFYKKLFNTFGPTSDIFIYKRIGI